jgi:diaminopimelate decarboxylase
MKILWRISIKEEASDKLATPFSIKFGDDIESEAKIHSRMKEIRDMGIKLEGIHFHCGSGQHGSSGFRKAILMARSCMEIGRKYGHRMETLDIGGGFPSGELSAKTVEALEITKNDPLGYKIIAEPGRHFSAYSFYLLTRVLGKRIKSGRTCYHLNESLYHSFNCNLMDGVTFENSTNQFYSKISAQNTEEESMGKMENSSLFGMTCDGLDIITKNLEVPKELKVSDWMCLSGMGAYTFGPKSSFNGMNCTETVKYWSAKLEGEGAS